MPRSAPPRLRLPALLALLALGAPAAAQDAAARERRVDSLFAEHTRTASPGVAVAVVRDGAVLLRRGYGLASLEHRVPITPTTVFDVASVSKQFTGLAVAMLVEQGKIRLADDVHAYIPELGDLGHPITIDHLLHHTSGIRDWPGTLALAGWRFDDVIAFDQILAMAYRQRTLNFVPGAEYTYSNTGYNLLAEVVARVTGQSFRAWTDAHLFRPLGMADSHFRDDHTEVIRDRASGYARAPDGSYRSTPDNLVALGSSSLFSTVDDLARWVANFDDPTVGGRGPMTLARTRGVLNDGSAIPYAFGISHGEYRGAPTLSHSGGWASFSTFVLHFPRQRLGVVVLANSGSINAGRAAHALADVFLDAELEPRAPPAPGAAAGASPAVARATLDRYAGLYRLGPGWYVRIRRDGDTLRARATREAEVAMTARADTAFWVEAYGAAMAFPRGAEPPALVYRGRRAPKLAESPPLSAAQLAALTGDYWSDELQTGYRVEARDGGLVLRHHRHGTIPLTRLWGDDFGGAAWFTRSVEFQRDGAGRVVGFAVLVDERSRNVRFTRRE